MTTKAVHRRKMHALQGSRRALPGIARDFEMKYRTEIAAHFEPRNFIETMWIGDIAFCTARIELTKLKIAAVEVRGLLGEADYIRGDEKIRADLARDDSPLFDRHAFEVLSKLENSKFSGDLAHNGVFNTVLAGASASHRFEPLGELQRQLHQETRERDRLINQLSRSQRQAMRDAIERAEAKHRAKLDGYEIALPTSDPDKDEPWSVTLSEPDAGMAHREPAEPSSADPTDEA